MQVTVQAEGLVSGEAAAVLELNGASTVGDAARRLVLIRSTGLMILVNGKLAGWDTVLHDGDLVELIPALGGG